MSSPFVFISQFTINDKGVRVVRSGKNENEDRTRNESFSKTL